MMRRILVSLISASISIILLNPLIMSADLKVNLDNREARLNIYNYGKASNSVELTSEDKKVDITYPAWLQNVSWERGGGAGGSLSIKTASQERTSNFQIKVKGNGHLVIQLVGPDRRQGNKKIPAWIDFKEISINGQAISGLPVRVSHDKPHKIVLSVKNDEILNVSLKHHKIPLSQISGFYDFILSDVILFILLFSGFWYGYKYFKDTNWNINKIFLCIMLPMSLLYLALLLTNENGYFSSGYDNRVYFCDFFEPIIFTINSNTYPLGSHNPPLLNILYYMFGQTGDYINISHKFIDPLGDVAKKLAFDAFHKTGNYAKAHLFIFAMAAFLLLPLFDKYKSDKPYKYALMFILIFSLPFSHAISTGNPMILAVALTTIYLLNYDNENARNREFALISLGIAAGLKLYPCVFGLLTLYRGNFKETLRLVLYGLIFVFLPFLFFKGGFANIPLIMENISKYNSGMWNYFSFRYLIYANAGFDGVLRGDLTRMIGTDYALLVDNFIVGLNCILFILIFTTNYFQKTEWKRVTQLVLLILTIVSNRSYPYFGLYLYACIVMFLNQAKFTKLNLVYLVLFVAILNPLKIWDNNILRAVSAHLMLIILTVESIISFLKSDKTEFKQLKLKLFSKGAEHV